LECLLVTQRKVKILYHKLNHYQLSRLDCCLEAFGDVPKQQLFVICGSKGSLKFFKFTRCGMVDEY
jgi:hypothetical protein